MITASDRRFRKRLNNWQIIISSLCIIMSILAALASFRIIDKTYEILKIILAISSFYLYLAYSIYKTREGDIFWNEERILLRTKARWKFNPPVIETELRYDDLDRVQAEITFPGGDTRLIMLYNYAALYARSDPETPAIKIGFQYHRKADILEFLTFLQSRWPEKCSEDIVEAINKGSFGN